MKRLTKITILISLLTIAAFGQEESPFATYDIPTHNLLKFNRFLINPSFSTVREVKSYFNMQHRNQSISFEDNYRAYFLSYSGRIGDRSGVGLGVFNQREGLIDNYGVLGNYAYGIKLTEHSNFTFAANIIYYYSGVNQNRANPVEADPALLSLENSSLFSFQPGFNISYKNFDFGLFAENLFDYNLNSNESVTEFNEKTFTGHVQYTHKLKRGFGLLKDGRLLSLARVRKVGDTDLIIGGNMILDLPSAGWLQLGYDDFYGASAGVGFNVGKRVSIGYTIEKGLSDNFENFGINHEISLAYSFTPTLTENMVFNKKKKRKLKKETKEAQVAQNSVSEEDELARLKNQIEENDRIINELLKEMDSTTTLTEAEYEKKYNEIIGGQKDEEENGFEDPFINTLNIPDVKDGYYLVANVFKSDKYVEEFVGKLEKKGLEPKFFENTLNGFKYVYLKHYKTIERASKAFQNNLDGLFDGDMWIIKIENSKAGDAEVIFEDDFLLDEKYDKQKSPQHK